MLKQELSLNNLDSLYSISYPLMFHWYQHSDKALIQISLKESQLLAKALKERIGFNTEFKTCGLGTGSYYSLLKGKPVRISTLKKILQFFSFDFNDYNKDILSIGGSKFLFKAVFPINLDRVESTILIGAFLSDGNNQKQHPFYANTDFLGEKILKNVQALIPGIPWEIRNGKLRFHPILSRLLLKLGVPFGDKILLNPKIPQFIYAREKYKKAYLTQIFDDEGHAPTKASRKIVLGRNVALRGLPKEFTSTLVYTKRVTFNSLPEYIKTIVSRQPPNLLNGEYELLKEFGIKSSLRCRGVTLYLDRVSADWVVELAGKENINKFNKEIGFSHPDKVRRINEYLGIENGNSILCQG
ncbi:MAG TPA: hypothetical protein VJH95_02740 [Candidatus Nanoarchaeia archaeon]|nr:hypothetical protein [Candidatus Nanoarchaeia archaeon]